MDDTAIALLEHTYDEGRSAMSRLLIMADGTPLPERCLMSFMGDALERFVEREGCEQVSNFHSEIRDFPLYAAQVDGVRILLTQAPVGAPAAAMMADLLSASGVKQLVACGGCGVMRHYDVGQLLVPSAALRDEGTSYHYVPPAREIRLQPEAVRSVTRTLAELGVPFEQVKVWTTDGFFRETPGIVRRRRDEGYAAVDMECAALAAVAQAYGFAFAELLYSGDSLAVPESHDERGWLDNSNARDVTLRASALALARGLC